MSDFDSDPKHPGGAPATGPAAAPFAIQGEKTTPAVTPARGPADGVQATPRAPWQGTLEDAKAAAEERFATAETVPVEVERLEELRQRSEATGSAPQEGADAAPMAVDSSEEASPELFAQPSSQGKKLQFAEDSENIPAPAPFDITQVEEPRAPAQAAADLTAPGTVPPLTPEAPPPLSPEEERAEAIRQAEFQAAETVEIQTVDPQTLEAPPNFASAVDAPPPYQGPPAADRRLALAIDVIARLRARMGAQILGRDEVVDLVLVALLADGHVLLEDFPGSGKTTLAKSLGSSIIDQLEAEEIADFRRIQFTPDLLPSDVTGVSIFDVTTNQFHFRRGPIFAHVVLADEINRTSPKVQAAMLEAMAEKQVTIDNVTYALDDLFFVIATQNPLDLAGTYPLPVAQLDRFLFKIRMDHIDRNSELEVLNTYRQRRDTERRDLPKVTRLDVLAARRAIDEHVTIDQGIKECLVDIAHALRHDERVLQGNSTRSLVLMLPALQAMAALRGRDYVSSDDIQTLIPRVLGHRVELAPGVNDLDQVLNEVMERPIEALSRSTLRRGR